MEIVTPNPTNWEGRWAEYVERVLFILEEKRWRPPERFQSSEPFTVCRPADRTWIPSDAMTRDVAGLRPVPAISFDEHIGRPIAIYVAEPVAAKQVRGRVGRLCPEMVRLSYWSPYTGNKEHANFYGRFGGYRHRDDHHSYGWQEITGSVIRNEGEPFTTRKSADLIQMNLGLSYARDWDWTVSVGRVEGIRIALPTDPQGVIAIFRLRDVPAGKSRRAALLHWVAEHYRRRRDGGLSEVRKHLRGQRRFVWNDFECCVSPAASDLRELDIVDQ